MNAANLAHALKAVRSGRQWKCKCVAHEDGSPSMIIFDGREQVQVRCMAGCDQRDLIAALRARGLWEREDWRDGIDHINRELTREQVMRDRARALFDGSVLCAGTIAETYLKKREIWTVAMALEDIRFRWDCPREAAVQPGLVVAMRSVLTRTIQAVQRIYIRPPGDKDGKPMMLGPVKDTAMQLEPRGVSRELHVAEGLESALGVMAMDKWPVWAMGSCGAIERLAVLDGIDRLVIWADHDRIDPRKGYRPGIKAAEVCAKRWREAGRVVDVYRPRGEGEDPWDVWRDRCGR